jgi:hypothetical protein
MTIVTTPVPGFLSMRFRRFSIGSGPLMIEVPILAASSISFRTSACQWLSVSLSQIHVSAFFAQSFASEIIISASCAACICTCSPLGPGTITMAPGSPFFASIKSGSGVGSTPKGMSSVGSSMSAIAAAAMST